jgi:hypothetical protein
MKQTDSAFSLQPSSFAFPSLVQTSLDIGRVLADRDGVTFRAQGTCMYPTVRPGDVLRIESRTAAQVKVGDIAVCRDSGFLFSHRVIATGERDGRAYIVTRPDRTREGSDGSMFDENLLGVVATITRNGAHVPLTPTRYPWLLRRYYQARAWWIETQPRAWLWLANTAARWQMRGWYRGLAHSWFALARPRITLTVRVPLRATDAIYQPVPAAEFKLTDGKWHGRTVERLTLALHLNAEKEPAAIAPFQHTPAGWVMQAIQVRLRYRGMALEEIMKTEGERLNQKVAQ